MRITFRWLARRLIAGATVPLLALALAVSAVRAQDTSSEESSTETTTAESNEETQKESATDQEPNQTTNRTTTSTTQSDRDASTSTSRNGQETRSTSRSDSQRTSGTRSRDRSDDEETTGPELGARRDTRESARDSLREGRQEAREGLRDTRERARDTLRDTRGQARDTAREAREGARDSARDTRDYARDTRRDYRDEWQDARRDTRDARRDLREDRRTDFRDDVRDFARDTAREAADYGRRTAGEAIDTARDASQRGRDAGREWDDYGRETGREWRDFARDTVRDARDFARDDDRDDRRRDAVDDRDSIRSRDSRDLRDSRDDFRSDRGSFADTRSRDARSRISRSQIDNFRATSVSARDLGLSLARTSRGLIVDDVRANAIARTIGLRPNDRIVSVEDYRVTSEDQFVRYLFDEDWRYDRVTVTVIRDGREVPIYVQPVQLIERLIVVQDDYDPLYTFGVVLDDRYDDELIVRRVLPNTVAYRAGLRQGDVIVRFHGQRLSTPRQFVQVLNRVDVQQAPIVVERDRRLREFQVSLPDELRTTSQRRTTYRREFDDGRLDNRGDTRWRDQRGAQIQYSGELYEDAYGAPSGVIPTQPGQPIYPGQYQPAQSVQPPGRIDDRSERPGILPRLFGR
jgi:hypothetical protein